MVANRKPRAKKPTPISKARKKKDAGQIPMERGLTTVPKDDVPPSQGGLFDHELTSEAMYDLIARKFKLQAAYREYNKIQKEWRESFKTLCKEQGIKDGQRIRIKPTPARMAAGEPPYAMSAKRRAGGGHEVSAWESLSAHDIHKV